MDLLHKATEVAKILHDNGFIAFFAGGFVRDLLCNNPSDDIDIATNASPEQICALFEKCILVGAQFGIVVVVHRTHQFEVSTFRTDALYIDGRRPTHVQLHGDPKEDAKRRDFTINGMFYDPIEKTIIDYVGGKKDLELGIVRAIGDPIARFKEDRLRMIRAVRFVARFDFALDPKTEEAIKSLSNTILPAVSKERIWQEFEKMNLFKSLDRCLVLMAKFGLLAALFEPLKGCTSDFVKKRLSGFGTILEKVPVILHLVTLFDDDAYILSLPDYLKTSSEEKNWVELYLALKNLKSMKQPFEDELLWVEILANHRAKTCIEVLTSEHRENDLKFIKNVRHLEMELFFYIECQHAKKWFFGAKDLAELGVHPGKEMGRILRLAKRKAIELRIVDKVKLMNELSTMMPL